MKTDKLKQKFTRHYLDLQGVHKWLVQLWFIIACLFGRIMTTSLYIPKKELKKIFYYG